MPVNTTWLQVSGQNPRPFKTKKAASEAFRTELEHLTSEGWAKAWGSTARGYLVLVKGEAREDEHSSSGRESKIRYTVLMLSTVDAEGYETDGSGRRVRAELLNSGQIPKLA